MPACARNMTKIDAKLSGDSSGGRACRDNFVVIVSKNNGSSFRGSCSCDWNRGSSGGSRSRFSCFLRNRRRSCGSSGSACANGIDDKNKLPYFNLIALFDKDLGDFSRFGSEGKDPESGNVSWILTRCL